MAIPNERRSTQELLRSGRFHHAALMASSKTKDLGTPVKNQCASLKAASLVTTDHGEEHVVAQALVAQAEQGAEDGIRMMELDLLQAVGKDRRSEGYRAVLPKGLGGILTPRGDKQAEAIITVAKRLQEYHPPLFKEYGKSLQQLAKDLIDAQQALKEAEEKVAAATHAELLARAALVKLLQKNEGQLISRFPGNRRKVRSFFRPTKRATAKSRVPEEG